MAKRLKKVRGKKRLMRNIESVVPKGGYCYSVRADGKGIQVCPFLRYDKTKHHQENGICEAFKMRDSEGTSGGLLWDMVKECGVNEDDYEEEYEKAGLSS